MLRRFEVGLVSVVAIAVFAACQSAGGTRRSPSIPATSVATSSAVVTSAPAKTPLEVETQSPEASDSLGWLTYTPADGSFSVSFPGTPRETTSTVGGAAVTGWGVQLGDVAYLVTRTRFAAGTFASATEASLAQYREAVLEGYATSTGGTVAAKSDSILGGANAIAATIDTGTQIHEIMVCVDGDDTWVLAVIHPTGSTSEVEFFMASFVLNP